MIMHDLHLDVHSNDACLKFFMLSSYNDCGWSLNLYRLYICGYCMVNKTCIIYWFPCLFACHVTLNYIRLYLFLLACYCCMCCFNVYAYNVIGTSVSGFYLGLKLLGRIKLQC